MSKTQEDHVKEKEEEVQELKGSMKYAIALAALAAAIVDMKEAIECMNKVYEHYPKLNDLQPSAFEKAIPMSLDDWDMYWSGMAVEYLKVIEKEVDGALEEA
jgi:hypothetical protein